MKYFTSIELRSNLQKCEPKRTFRIERIQSFKMFTERERKEMISSKKALIWAPLGVAILPSFIFFYVVKFLEKSLESCLYLPLSAHLMCDILGSYILLIDKLINLITLIGQPN